MTLPTLLTIGYEDAELDAFLDTLQAAGVTLLADTRERAQSRRKGYSKTALGLALKDRGIGYRHFRALGTPPAIRKAYKLDKDFGALKAGYALHLATQGTALDELGALAARERVALLCYEADPATCHRSLIAGRLQVLGLVGEVEDLMVVGRKKAREAKLAQAYQDAGDEMRRDPLFDLDSGHGLSNEGELD